MVSKFASTCRVFGVVSEESVLATVVVTGFWVIPGSVVIIFSDVLKFVPVSLNRELTTGAVLMSVLALFVSLMSLSLSLSLSTWPTLAGSCKSVCCSLLMLAVSKA